jgi:TPR repeat protein
MGKALWRSFKFAWVAAVAGACVFGLWKAAKPGPASRPASYQEQAPASVPISPSAEAPTPAPNSQGSPDQGQTKESVDSLRAKAGQGEAQALFELGERYYEGRGWRRT